MDDRLLFMFPVVHTHTHTHTLTHTLQQGKVRSDTAVGTPDYISPEV